MLEVNSGGRFLPALKGVNDGFAYLVLRWMSGTTDNLRVIRLVANHCQSAAAKLANPINIGIRTK